MTNLHRHVSELLLNSTSTILSSHLNCDLVRLRKYVFYVFSDDWLHNNLPSSNRGITGYQLHKLAQADSIVMPGSYGGDYDQPDQKLCHRFIKHFGSVNLIDLGANYGHEGLRYALLAKAIGVPFKIHVAVEPGLAGLLLPANMLLHGLPDVIHVAAALSDVDSISLLHFDPKVTTGSTLTYNPKASRPFTCPVRLITLDTIAKETGLDGPTFLKIDIQGAEKHLTSDFSSYLKRNICAGVCELLPGDHGSSANAIQFLLHLMQHFILIDVGIHRDKPCTKVTRPEQLVREILDSPRPWTDLLFYPHDLGEDFLLS